MPLLNYRSCFRVPGGSTPRSSFALEQFEGERFAPKAIAQNYIGLDDRNRAFEFLSKAIDVENTSLLPIESSPKRIQ